jgi:hypothetical protein
MPEMFAVGAVVEPVFPITRRIGWRSKGVIVDRFAPDPINWPNGGLVVDFTVNGGLEVDRVLVEEHEVIDVVALDRAWKRAGL